MLYVKAIYKIPSQHVVYFIVSPVENNLELSQHQKDRKRTLYNFSNILEEKDCKCKKKQEAWTLEIIFQNDFLDSIYKNTISHVSPEIQRWFQSQQPPKLELLTVNYLNNNFKKHKNLQHISEKMVGMPKSSDIIQIYI